MAVINGNASTPLAAALLDAFVAAGRTKAVLPPNRRDEVIAVLTRLMADPDALQDYTASLEDERRRRGRDIELHLLGMAGLDIPDHQIAAQGFNGLSDDELADIALSPEAIHAIREHLDDPEVQCGPWLIDTILEIEAARPDAKERARRGEQIYQSLRNAGLLATAKSETIPMVKHKEDRRPTVRSRLRPAPGLLAIAASLLVGVLLGGLAFRGKGSTAPQTELLLASVTPRFGTTRGAEHSLFIDVASVRSGFATLVTLAPGRPQQVFPEPGDPPLRAEPSVPHSYGPLPSDSTSALLLITETPATNLIRDALLSQEFRAADLDRLDSYLRKLLAEAGYRWVGMSFTLLTPRETR